MDASAMHDRSHLSLVSRLGCLFISAWLSVGQADDRVWLIGSGPDVENTQVQIERNLLWIREVLGRVPGQRRVDSFFTDGEDPAPDITQRNTLTDDPESLQPLARVYDSYYLNAESVRNHQVGDLRGAATREVVHTALQKDLASLGSGDQGLLIYLGHGSASNGVSQLDLWEQSHLTARDLRELLQAQPPHTLLRLVFTQCYSGGFHKAVLSDEPVATSADAAATRCGFYAVAAEQLAEGCSASLNVEDYRGYSSYFFAALAGQARNGNALQAQPDRNHDGQVDPYEAHLYSLRAARSTDLPRSSSEQYLLDWAPWYLPIVSVSARPDNPYRELAAALVTDLGLTGQGAALRRAILRHRKAVQLQIQGLIYRQEQARSRAQGAREQLRWDLETRWPDARYAYTQAYRRFMLEQADEAQGFILAHPLYRDLVADQDLYWTLERALHELRRRLAQLDRIQHLQRLARLRDAILNRTAGVERQRYLQLLRCEQQPL